MSHPLVIAYHLIWTAYGYWLPNDPRGSGSRTIRNDIIAELGELHHGRKRVQPAGAVEGEFHAGREALAADADGDRGAAPATGGEDVCAGRLARRHGLAPRGDDDKNHNEEGEERRRAHARIPRKVAACGLAFAGWCHTTCDATRRER